MIERFGMELDPKQVAAGFKRHLPGATQSDIERAVDLFALVCEQSSFRKCAKIQGELIKHLTACRPSKELTAVLQADICDYLGYCGWRSVLLGRDPDDMAMADAPSPSPTPRRRLSESKS